LHLVQYFIPLSGSVAEECEALLVPQLHFPQSVLSYLCCDSIHFSLHTAASSFLDFLGGSLAASGSRRGPRRRGHLGR
jgi:hypothetical protein